MKDAFRKFWGLWLLAAIGLVVVTVVIVRYVAVGDHDVDPQDEVVLPKHETIRKVK